MIVLGLSFSHDAGVAVVDGGRTVALLQRERFTRVKRSALMTAEFIEFALERTGLAWSDVDAVAVATGQSWPWILLDPEALFLEPDVEQARFFGLRDQLLAPIRSGLSWIRGLDAEARARFERTFGPEGLYREYISDPELRVDLERQVFANIDWPYRPAWWQEACRTGDVATWCAKITNSPPPKYGYMPARIRLRGCAKPAVLVPHHLAHAANAFYQSDRDTAAIYTIDNGDKTTPRRGYVGGLYALGQGTRLMPVGPTYASHGHLYQRMAEFLYLGHGSGAGKLMGLAPYGQPRFADRRMIGNAFEIQGREYALGLAGHRNSVLEKVFERARWLGARIYDDPQAPTQHHEAGALGADNLRAFHVDMAATAQWLFEEGSLDGVRAFAEGLHLAGIGTEVLCIGGGGALNCPANSRLWREGPFRAVFVPPCCDDSGLPLGAALAASHDLLGLPRQPQSADTAQGAYLGLEYAPAEVARAIASAGSAVRATQCPDAAAAAAADVAAGRIVGWYEGRSEVGPRALGHRSILADPRGQETWRQVNRVKRREYWRPFAPAVLAERAGDWFAGAPGNSPFMLFTARVKGDRLPAVTHVDGSARIQTVDGTAGGFRRVLEAFERQTGVPVVLNTSFNGPGEPIVETPAEALRFLTSSGIDAIHIGGFRVSRAEAHD